MHFNPLLSALGVSSLALGAVSAKVGVRRQFPKIWNCGAASAAIGFAFLLYGACHEKR